MVGKATLTYSSAERTLLLAFQTGVELRTRDEIKVLMDEVIREAKVLTERSLFI